MAIVSPVYSEAHGKHVDPFALDILVILICVLRSIESYIHKHITFQYLELLL